MSTIVSLALISDKGNSLIFPIGGFSGMFSPLSTYQNDSTLVVDNERLFHPAKSWLMLNIAQFHILTPNNPPVLLCKGGGKIRCRDSNPAKPKRAQRALALFLCLLFSYACVMVAEWGSLRGGGRFRLGAVVRTLLSRLHEFELIEAV
jgi:hypothetical protein